MSDPGVKAARFGVSPQVLQARERAYGEAVATRRRHLAVLLAVLVVLTLVSAWVGEVDLGNLARNAWRLPDFVGRTMPALSWAQLGADLAEWFWGLDRWLMLLGETLLVAYLGTVVGAVCAFLLCFLGSANLMATRGVVFGARRVMEVCRTVPDVVFALVFVIAFGLGPLPGVLALAIHTAGALGKLFAEVVENIDMRPVEGLGACGGTLPEVIRHAVLPQVLPNFASYALLRFEVNVRGAAVMGFVGAGGIGQELLEAVRKFYYADISAILVLIMLTVVLIDLLTERLRHRLHEVEAIQ
jgi:phosphonate transport system permease protein